MPSPGMHSGSHARAAAALAVGDAAPVWVPDQRVTMCQLCSLEFGLVNRRHHCRACGKRGGGLHLIDWLWLNFGSVGF